MDASGPHKSPQFLNPHSGPSSTYRICAREQLTSTLRRFDDSTQKTLKLSLAPTQCNYSRYYDLTLNPKAKFAASV